MKKILAILGVVAMLFAACTPYKGGDTEIVPTFPELQELTVESGKSYEITFTADRSWSVSLPADYATLTYTSEDGYTSTDTQFYGEEGEHTIIVNVRESAVSYAKDIVFTVDMTLDSYTESIAKLTIPRTPYEIYVAGAAPVGMENDVFSKFENGGHPENGPFASSANTYTVRYLSSADAKYGDYVVYHDCDLLYNYVVYAKNSADGEFAAVEEGCPWLTLRKFQKTIETTDEKGVVVSKITYPAFSLEMIHTNGKAVKSDGVGYEAYVNLEDEHGDALVSVYFLYDPTAVVEVKTSLTLANEALAADKGVTLTGTDPNYTMTLSSPELIGAEYEAAKLKLEGFSEFFGGFESGNTNLIFNSNVEEGICYISLKEGVDATILNREEVLKISGTVKGGVLHEYTINVVFDWIEATTEEETPVE